MERADERFLQHSKDLYDALLRNRMDRMVAVMEAQSKKSSTGAFVHSFVFYMKFYPEIALYFFSSFCYPFKLKSLFWINMSASVFLINRET